MATIFDLLNALNNNSNLYSSLAADSGECKRQQQQQQSELKVINFIPEMEVTMYDDKLVIDVELSGVSKDNIEIDIKDSILTIQGEKKKRENKDTTSLVNTTTTTAAAIKNDNDNSDGPSIEEFEDTEHNQKLKQPNANTKNNNNNSNETTITTTSPSSSNTKTNNNNNNNTGCSSGKKYISERSFGYFKRFIDLSKIIYQLDLTEITTKFENGLLTIEINKKSSHLNNFKISIN